MKNLDSPLVERGVQQFEKQWSPQSNRWESKLSYRFYDFLFGLNDPVALDVFRRFFSLTLLIYIIDRMRTPYEWLTNQGFHFSAEAKVWWYPDPLPLLSESMVWPFLSVFIISLIALIFGRYTRFFSCVVFLCVTYVTLVDTEAAATLNMIYVALFLLFIVLPKTKDNYISSWPLRIIQATLLIIYVGALLSKTVYGDWIQNPYALWSHMQGIYMTDFAALMLRTLPQWAFSVLQWGALLFECAAPILFIVPKTRYIAMIIGILFHGIIALTFYKFYFFSLQMISFYIVFIKAEHLLALIKGEQFQRYHQLQRQLP